MKQFFTGQKLKTRSICDHECIYTAVVLKRTNKTITIELEGRSERRKISIYDNCESIYPFGKYSMAPIFTAAC